MGQSSVETQSRRESADQGAARLFLEEKRRWQHPRSPLLIALENDGAFPARVKENKLLLLPPSNPPPPPHCSHKVKVDLETRKSPNCQASQAPREERNINT